MAKTKRAYILATFVLSTIACICTFVSLGTENWVVSDVKFGESTSEVLYGLFTGSYKRTIDGESYNVYQVQMTCDIGENVCAVLCGSDTERNQELSKLIQKESIAYNTNCQKIPRMHQYLPRRHYAADDTYEPTFINAGIWVSCIFFLVTSGVFSVIATLFSLWNTIDNPINPYFNVLGLYIYNSIALTCSLIATVMWGVHFGITLSRNVSLLDTITNIMKSEGLAVLGYSYWLLILSWLAHFANVCLLYTREYLINQKPDVNVHYDDAADPAIIIY